MGSVQRKVAIVTGASQGTGAGLITAYRRHGFAVVACSRSLTESRDSDVLAFAGATLTLGPQDASWTQPSPTSAEWTR